MGSAVCIQDREQTYVADFAVQSKADVSCLEVPDPLEDGKMPVIIECEQILMDEIGHRVGVNGGLAGHCRLPRVFGALTSCSTIWWMIRPWCKTCSRYRWRRRDHLGRYRLSGVVSESSM